MSNAPRMRIAELHVRDLPPFGRLDWPEDASNLDGVVPAQLVVGGVNGSGKSTLLDLVYWLFRSLAPPQGSLPTHLPSSVSAWMDIEVSLPDGAGDVVRAMIGDAELRKEKKTAQFTMFERTGKHEFNWLDESDLARQIVSSGEPGLVFFPSERDIVVPEEPLTGPARRNISRFAYKWRPPGKKADRVDALLESLRSDYLNAKEEGLDEPIRKYESCMETFGSLTEGRKSIVWKKPTGEHFRPFVEVKATKDVHELQSLSSGEKQLLLLGTEIGHAWRDGSLLMIDEPELHLHSKWISRLWELLAKWREKRNGQLVLATQSAQLFALAGPSNSVMIGPEAEL
jgi:hypothetical protein